MFAGRTNWDLSGNRFSRALEQHRNAGKELLDLMASNPTQCVFKYDQAAILSALKNRDALHYQPLPKGLPAARAAVAAYYRERSSGRGVDPGSIILATSTSEAYSFIFRLLCEAGDELLVPAPSYPLFELLGQIQDLRLAHYSLIYDHGWQMDFGSLRSALTPRSRAVIVVNPNNPTGSFVKPQEIAALNEICSQHEMAIVADEVFLDYAHNDLPRPSLAFNHDALTFTISGISKICALPQMKLAWMLVSGPDALVREAVRRLEVISDTYLSMSAPLQLALPAFLQQRHELQRQITKRIRANMQELDRQLASYAACRRLQIEGGWYAVLRVPATRSDEDLAIALLEEKSVLAHPGHFYDFPDDGYLVLSLITPLKKFRQGLRRLLGFINRD